MYQDTYYIPKRTGTYSDVLVAYGLASLLDHIFRQVKDPTERWRIVLEDGGGHYLVRLSEPVREEWCKTCSFFEPLPFVTRTGIAVPVGVGSFRDRDQERSDFFRYAQSGNQVLNGTQMDPPRPDFRVLDFVGHRNVQITNPTTNGFQSYNAMVVRWAKYRDKVNISVATILEMFAAPEMDLDSISQKWRRLTEAESDDVTITCSQALNPMQGQGQNKPKANALDTRQNLKEFWLLEYLKAVGLWRCAAPQLVRPPLRNPTTRDWDKADWKVYVLAPLLLPFSAHSRVFDGFRSVVSSETSLKLDIICVLLFTKHWLSYVEAAWRDEDEFDIPAAPEKVVAGFHVAQFKLLSRNAYTMINLSFLSLPAWSGNLRTRADVAALQEIIDEHLDVVRGINEGRSDGFDLLRRYRDFVSSGNWEAFFDFMASYSHEILQRLNEGQRFVPTFTTSQLRRLMMTNRKDLTPIIENSGFQNVAYAIRHATIVPQTRKANGQDTLYEVRYGLGAELKRKGTVREEFVAALTDFIQSYNQENVQKLESKGQQMRRDVRTTDIAEVVRLIDEYGSEVVANLLIAYGYAREPREEQPNP
jgi:hypothetical protein